MQHCAKLIILLLFICFAHLGIAEPEYGVAYKVPVSDPTIRPWATFNLDVSCATSSTGQKVIQYAYPVELTGVPVNLELRQSRFDSSTYFGPHAEMKCSGSICFVYYYDLPHDDVALATVLKTISQSPAELEGRLQVARSNEADPGGEFAQGPLDYCP